MENECLYYKLQFWNNWTAGLHLFCLSIPTRHEMVLMRPCSWEFYHLSIEIVFCDITTWIDYLRILPFHPVGYLLVNWASILWYYYLIWIIWESFLFLLLDISSLFIHSLLLMCFIFLCSSSSSFYLLKAMIGNTRRTCELFFFFAFLSPIVSLKPCIP